MFIKHEFKLEMFVAVSWSYGKWWILIIKSTVPLVNHFMIKVWILALLYKSNRCFIEILQLTYTLQFRVVE